MTNMNSKLAIEDRIEELEDIFDEKESSMSKTAFRRFKAFSDEAMEMSTLKARLDTLNSQDRAKAAPKNEWHADPATDAQLRYLTTLGVCKEPNMTKKRASDLISAAKDGDLGSIGGFYVSGSN